MRNFAHRNSFVQRLNQLFWKLGIKIQQILHINRNRNQLFKKAANWVSITDNCVAFLLCRKKEVLKKYRFSMCGDEFFVSSELESSAGNHKVKYCDRLLKVDVKRSHSSSYHLEDYEDLINSQCLFARKFGSEDMEVVDKILDHIKSIKS